MTIRIDRAHKAEAACRHRWWSRLEWRTAIQSEKIRFDRKDTHCIRSNTSHRCYRRRCRIPRLRHFAKFLHHRGCRQRKSDRSRPDTPKSVRGDKGRRINTNLKKPFCDENSFSCLIAWRDAPQAYCLSRIAGSPKNIHVFRIS